MDSISSCAVQTVQYKADAIMAFCNIVVLAVAREVQSCAALSPNLSLRSDLQICLQCSIGIWIT